jgi:Cu-Zn family superoxide dismutase
MYSRFSFKTLFHALIAIFAFTITSCNSNETNTSSETSDTTTVMSDTTSATNNVSNQTGNMAEAILSGTQQDTTVTGTVRFNEENGKVKMTLDIMVPKKANQSVAVHIHEHGDCGDMGKMAHGHWNPTKMNHGKWGSASFHSGDIGNVDLNGEGKGTLEMETDLWTISGTDSTKNILNKAIIVHGGKDDYTTQPTGNAGSRIGCGVITKK